MAMELPQLVLAWLALAGCAVGAGWRHWSAVAGAVGRLLIAAAYSASLAIAPLAVWFGMREAAVVASWNLALSLTVLSSLRMLLGMRPPYTLAATSAELPKRDIKAGVDALCRAFGIQMPEIRVTRSLGGPEMMLGAVGGLPAPAVVMSDLIYHRLSPEESQAILAHELAHIANRSLWILALRVPLSSMLIVAMSGYFTAEFSLAFGFAFYVGAGTLLSRAIEQDCDRRAARVVGFRRMISALAKIHALHPAPNSGWLSVLAYAMASHPSRSTRLALLDRAAPVGDKPDHEVPARVFWIQRGLSLTALLLWLVLLIVAWKTAAPLSRRIDVQLMPLLLFFVAGMPSILLSIAMRRRTDRIANRVRTRRRAWKVVLLGFAVFFAALIAATAIAFAMMAADEAKMDTDFWAWVVVATLFAIGAIWCIRSFRAQRSVYAALRQHDFPKALELGAKLPRRLARRPSWRYTLGIAALAAGDRTRAVADLEQLLRDVPNFRAGILALAAIYLDEGRLDAAIELAEQATRLLPKDPDAWCSLARAYERTDRLEDAQRAIEQALRADSEDGSAWGVAALLAARREDAESAQRLLEKALEHGPGSPLVLFIQAKLAVAERGVNESRELIEAALTAIEVNPFAVMKTETNELSALTMAGRPSADLPSG